MKRLLTAFCLLGCSGVVHASGIYNPGSGGGSGGASTLAVSVGGVQVTSPTARIDVDSNTFTGSASGGNVASIGLNGSSVTLQGNTFNAASKLVQLNSSTQYPGLDGSLILKVSSLTTSGVTSGSYGTASNVSSFTVNAQGQITGAANVPIAISTSNLTATGASGSNFLRSDNTWATPAGGSGSSTLAISTGGVIVTSPTVRVDFDSNTFVGNGANNISSITMNTSSVTLQGNTFNGNSQLIKFDSSSNYPAGNGSSITNLTGSNVGSGVPAANIAGGSLGNTVIASSIAASGVTTGTYGDASHVSSITVAIDGRITKAANVSILISTTGLSATGASGTNFLRSDNTWATPAGSGAQDFDLKDTTGSFNRTIDHSTNSIVDVSTIGFSGAYDSNSNPWYAVPSSFTAVYSGAAGQTFTGTSSVTVNGLQFWAPATSTMTGYFDLYMNNSSSNSGGYKFLMTGPSGAAYFEMTGGGSGASATAANLAQQASALNTKTGTNIGTYTSNPAWFHFGFQLITGATAGLVNVQIVPATGSGTNTINSESQMMVMLKK